MFASWSRCHRLSSTLFSTAFLQMIRAAGPTSLACMCSLLWGSPYKEGGLGYFTKAKHFNHCSVVGVKDREGIRNWQSRERRCADDWQNGGPASCILPGNENTPPNMKIVGYWEQRWREILSHCDYMSGSDSHWVHWGTIAVVCSRYWTWASVGCFITHWVWTLGS